ncbi:U32 family peptidase [Patescibacteria group bacterium]|nr:U32 family peptidase [Patescibacteria group bacterium]
MKKNTELVLPGGDFERAKIALDYGADAVYVGLNKYSLRKGEVRFDIEEIGKAIDYAHSKKKKLYVTFNIFAHQEHLTTLKKDLEEISHFQPDAFIIADIGIIQIAKKIAPQIPIHVSTQANVTNSEQIKFYKSIGAKRVVLARELTLKEIKKIRKVEPEMELEVFAHGSMCISYSGRCLLSNYMTGRHANLGDCAQPCRWDYRVAQSTKQKSESMKHQIPNKSQKSNSKYDIQNSICYLEETQRPGEYFEIEESDSSTNIMSSKDICTIEYIDEMIKAGINGFKVEGRNKTEYYLASTALAYREAIDLAKENKYSEKDKKRLKKELQKIAHRDYTSGFIFNEAKKGETYQGRSPIEQYRYIAQITKIKSQNTKKYKVIVKNKIKKDMAVEVLTPSGIKKDKILDIMVDGSAVNEISPGKNDQGATILLKNIYSEDNFIRTKKCQNFEL